MPPVSTAASFDALAGVPVHYDRRFPGDYGSDGERKTFRCTKKLHTSLEACFGELFAIIPHGRPRIILTAGTIGDGENAHGKGLAFDLDGLVWDELRLPMARFTGNERLYLGINAHLFLHFSQVLNFYYPRHEDHFHVDFNFQRSFREASNAQTMFVQAVLVYLYGADIGNYGKLGDGVDGVFGDGTRKQLAKLLKQATFDMKVAELSEPAGWAKFLKLVRTAAFRVEA